MKIFLATDVHGSAYWAEKVVQKFEQSGAETLVLLGDIYNHGPRNPLPKDYAPMKVAEILSAVSDKLVVVRGNCDSEVDQMISKFDFVSEASMFLNDGAQRRRLFFTHGHIHNKDNLPHLKAGDVMFYGHFHKNEIVDVNGVICVNVSSCSLPKDTSAFCVVDEKQIIISDFDDNVLLSRNF
jgi:hypothetical protein